MYLITVYYYYSDFKIQKYIRLAVAQTILYFKLCLVCIIMFTLQNIYVLFYKYYFCIYKFMYEQRNNLCLTIIIYDWLLPVNTKYRNFGLYGFMFVNSEIDKLFVKTCTTYSK